MRLQLLLCAFAPGLASGQLVTLEFIGGGTASYAIDEVRSVEFASGNKVVNLFDGTVLSWPIASIERELVGEITTSIVGHGSPDPLSVFPSPTTGSVNISFSIDHACPIDVTIHDAQGRLIRGLMRGERPAGEVSLVWDGVSSSGGSAAPGRYLVNVQCGHLRIAKSIVLTY